MVKPQLSWLFPTYVQLNPHPPPSCLCLFFRPFSVNTCDSSANHSCVFKPVSPSLFVGLLVFHPVFLCLFPGPRVCPCFAFRGFWFVLNFSLFFFFGLGRSFVSCFLLFCFCFWTLDFSLLFKLASVCIWLPHIFTNFSNNHILYCLWELVSGDNGYWNIDKNVFFYFFIKFMTQQS